MKNFKLIKSGIDPKPVLDSLAAHRELWDAITARQTFEGSAHVDTECIYLRAPADPANFFECLDSVPCPEFVDAIGHPIVNLVNEVVRIIGARALGHSMLVKLLANGHIRAHTDEGSYARYYARFHVVLSGHCVFHCGGERVHMRTGELWWFNHQKEHKVQGGKKDRINLILDALAPGYTGALGSCP